MITDILIATVGLGCIFAALLIVREKQKSKKPPVLPESEWEANLTKKS